MKPGWIIWWWLFDWEMFSIVLGICMLGPQLVALLVWCSLIGRRTSEGQTLRCKTYFHLQFSLCFLLAVEAVTSLSAFAMLPLLSVSWFWSWCFILATEKQRIQWYCYCCVAIFTKLKYPLLEGDQQDPRSQWNFTEVTGSTSLPPQCYISNKHLLRKGDHWVEVPPSWAGVSREVAFLDFCSWWDGSFGAGTMFELPMFQSITPHQHSYKHPQ